MIRDQLGSFEWAWWSLTAVVVVMLLIVTANFHGITASLSRRR